MMLSKEVILNKLDEWPSLADSSAARAFLNSVVVEKFNPLISGKLAEELIATPKMIVGTWECRNKNADRKGFKLHGCADFVRTLNSIPDSTELMLVTFKSNEGVAMFWLNRKSDELVGFVIANRKQIDKDLQDELE